MNPRKKHSGFIPYMQSLGSILCCLYFIHAYAESNTLKGNSLSVDYSISSKPNSYKIREPTGALELSQALALALMRSPELAAFSREIRAREAVTLQASLMPNPVLMVKALNFGNNAFKDFDGDTIKIQLSQLVELGGKRAARTKAATLSQALANWDYESKRIDILAQVTQTFIRVLTAQQRVLLQQQLLAISTQVMRTATAQVQAGSVTPMEGTKARVAEASSRIELMRAERELESVRQQLVAIWGGSEAKFTYVLGDLSHIQPLPKLDSLLQRFQENPDMARWMTEITRRQAVITREKSKAIPNINVSLGTILKTIPGDTALMAGFSMPIQFFDRNQGNISAAEQRLNQAEENRHNTELSIRTALNTRYSQLNTAYTTVSILRQEIIPGAQSAFDAASRGYRLGKFGFLDVLDAQRTLFRVKAQYLQALSDYHLSVIGTERLIGGALNPLSEPVSESSL